MSRYHIEVEVNDEAHGYEEYGYLSYGTIVGEGDSLEECLKTATIDLIDQDGGTFRDDVEADEDWMQIKIERAFMDKYPPPEPDWRDAQRKLTNEHRALVVEMNARNGWSRR